MGAAQSGCRCPISGKAGTWELLPRSQPWQRPQARAGDDAQGEVGAFISPAAGAGENSPAFGHRSSSPCPRFLIISADLAQAPSTPHGPLPSLQPRLCPWQALGGAAKPSQRRCWDGRTGCVTSDISLQCGLCLQHCQGTRDRDVLVFVLARLRSSRWLRDTREERRG